jgi:hypothetical protein
MLMLNWKLCFSGHLGENMLSCGNHLKLCFLHVQCISGQPGDIMLSQGMLVIFVVLDVVFSGITVGHDTFL